MGGVINIWSVMVLTSLAWKTLAPECGPEPLTPAPSAQVLPVPPEVQPGAPDSKSSMKWITGRVPMPQSPGAATVVNDQIADHGPRPQVLFDSTRHQYWVLVVRSLAAVNSLSVIPAWSITRFEKPASVATWR